MLKLFLKNDKGEAYVGEATKIIIAIVLGVALLTGCILIFNNVILPNIEYAIEWGFSNAGEKVEEIEHSSTYKSFIDEVNSIVKNEFNSMPEDELQEYCDDINSEYPETAPPGGLTQQNIKDGKTYLYHAYAIDNGVTYAEAEALGKTTEGQQQLMEWADL